MVKYSQSLPGPSQYEVGSTLTKKGASMKPRLADLSLKYIKDVLIKLMIIDSRAWRIFSPIINKQWIKKSI